MFGSFSIASKAMKIPMEKDYVVLATFICVKISVLYLSNFYYRIWRYVEIIEIMGYFVVTVIATVLLAAILFLKGKTGIYSAYFFVFDFLLTFTGIIISRFFYRWLNELISRNRSIEKKAIIYGAGESGCFLMKELLQNQKHALKPVGWIDDDKSKHNMFLCGYKIYGGQDQLLDICSKIKPDMILISTTEIDKSIEDAIRAKLANQNIGVGRFGLTFLYS